MSVKGGVVLVKLPEKNKYGFYEIRMESIGGMGANIAGKIIAEAGVFSLGLNAISFSSYGSEKRGTPVKSFIRFSETDDEIRVNSAVENPHMLVIFHENLKKTLAVLAGFKKGNTVILNTDKSPSEARDYLEIPSGKVVCVDAIRIASEEKTKLNVVMMGAISRVSGFLTPEVLIEAMKETFGKKYPKLMEGNIKGFKRGYEALKIQEFTDDGKYKEVAYEVLERDVGYDNQPMGGVILQIGNTAMKDLSTSREAKIPVFLPEKCIHCGLCESTCPDYCFVFEEEVVDGKQKVINKGINYQYCKGCMRCVSVCPVDAIVEGAERDYNVDDMTVTLTMDHRINPGVINE